MGLTWIFCGILWVFRSVSCNGYIAIIRGVNVFIFLSKKWHYVMS
jgi:hypothetical protein